MNDSHDTSAPREGLVGRLLPGLVALRDYRIGHIPDEFVAGATTAVMLVPQAMAYAMLAGLPPIVGLYASIVPIVIYAVLGTSRQLAVGPVALMSLVLADGLSEMTEPGSAEYVELAAVSAGVAGVLLTGLGLARLGFLTDFVASPVVAGFTAAAAILIAGSQAGHLFNVELADTRTIQAAVKSLVDVVGEIHGTTAVIGTSCIVVLAVLGRYMPRIPRALVLVAVATVGVIAFDLHENGIAIVGEVPRGLPPLLVPTTVPGEVVSLLPTAFICAFVGFMESYAVMDTIARRRGDTIRPNQELVALGSANIGASLFGGYPIAGALSRTAVNDRAGARGPLAALFTAALVAAVLMFLPGTLYFVPKLALAAIIIVAAVGLIDFERVFYLLDVDRTDLVVLVVTFAATLGLGIESGLLVGVIASLVVFVGRAARPRVAILGRLPGSEAYGDVRRHPEAEQIDGVLVLRVEGRFFFANADRVTRRIRDRAREHAPHTVVIDGSGVDALDSTSVAVLEGLLEALEADGRRLVLASLTEPVAEVLERSGLIDRLGTAAVFDLVHEAVELNLQPQR